MSGGSDRCLILGAGGHARVCVDVLRLALPDLELAALDPNRAAFLRADVPVVGSDADLGRLKSEGWNRFTVGLGLVAGNDRRVDLFEEALAEGLEPLSFCHPTAVLSETVEIGAGTQIMALSVLQTGLKLGRNCVVNTQAVLEHDVEAGDHAFFGPHATVLGSAKIGSRAIIGAGAVVLPGAQVPDRALVKAGSVFG